MKFTKFFLLSSILIIGTSCDLSNDGNDNNSSNSNKEGSKRLQSIVADMNHSNDECPAIRGVYKQNDTVDATDFEPVYRELSQDGEQTIYKLDNDTFIIDGKSHQGTIEGARFTYAGSCELGELKLTSVSDLFFSEGVVKSLENGDIQETFKMIENGVVTKEEVTSTLQ